MDKQHVIAIHMIVIIIFIACVMMNWPMRPGLPIDTAPIERMDYISDHLWIWKLGWFTWMLSALGLLTFCLILFHQLSPSLLAKVGIIVVAIGIAPDLTAEVLYAFVLPYLAALGDEASFLLFERIASYLTGFLGNGLYNIGGLLITLVANQQKRLPHWVFAWGITSWALGIGLSLAMAAESIKWAEIMTAISMILSTVWMLLIAHTLLQPQTSTHHDRIHTS